MKVKNLNIGGWCPICKKPTSFTYNTVIGASYDDDPDAVELPASCLCNAISAARAMPILTGFSSEIMTIPNTASLYSNHFEALWQIAQEVAERDSTFFESDAPIENWQCPFCNGGQTFHSHARKEPFPHQPDCIVTKACALIEQRKQLPQITVKLAVDGKTKETCV